MLFALKQSMSGFRWPMPREIGTTQNSNHGCEMPNESALSQACSQNGGVSMSNAVRSTNVLNCRLANRSKAGVEVLVRVARRITEPFHTFRYSHQGLSAQAACPAESVRQRTTRSAWMPTGWLDSSPPIPGGPAGRSESTWRMLGSSWRAWRTTLLLRGLGATTS